MSTSMLEDPAGTAFGREPSTLGGATLGTITLGTVGATMGLVVTTGVDRGGCVGGVTTVVGATDVVTTVGGAVVGAAVVATTVVGAAVVTGGVVVVGGRVTGGAVVATTVAALGSVDWANAGAVTRVRNTVVSSAVRLGKVAATREVYRCVKPHPRHR